MLRLFSASAIIVISGAVGLLLRTALEIKMKSLKALVSDMNSFENVLKYERLEAHKIVSRLGKNGEYKELWTDLDARMRAGASLASAWESVRPGLILDKNAVNELGSYFASFGTVGSEGETNKLELLKKRLLDEEKRENEDADKRLKLAFAAPVFLGLALAMTVL